MKKLLLGFVFLFVLSGTSVSAYTDLDDQDDFYNAITHWSEAGVLQGYDDDTFQSDNDINRAEFLKIVMAVSGEDLGGEDCYSDVTDEWFAEYICTATDLGYVEGYEDGNFKPEQTINFAEASKIVANVLDVELAEEDEDIWYKHYIEGLAKQEAIPDTIASFSDNISRGEMAEITWRVDQKPSYTENISYSEITRRERAVENNGQGYYFDSCQDLESYLEDNTYDYYWGDDVMMAEELVDNTSAAAPGPQSSAKSVDYSETNIQVKGVDEADIVKTDGEYIYYVNNSTVKVMKAYAPEKMELLSALDFADLSFYPSELYVDGDQLVVLGRSYSDLYALFEEEVIDDYYYYGDTLTKVYIFDISDKADISIERELDFEGDYLSSRKVDDNIYLVMNRYSNYYDDFVEDTVIPMYGDTKDAQLHASTSCDDILYFPGETSTVFLVVASIPLDNEEDVSTEVIIGSGEDIYSSRENLYIAASSYDWWYWDDYDEETTYIHKFALGDEVTYEGKGEVPGYIDNQFSMDEHEGYFRLTTTTGYAWDDNSANHLYVLNDDLEVVGSIENIAPGETIYSTRFMGDRAYLVTFKKVDPFFVIDVSTPTNPEILGYLKIPGYSDYLHPYGEDYVIGFGKDTAEPTEEEGFWGQVDFAWFQGLKIAMFDVSDVENPIELHKEIIGDRGSSTELLYNHKALLFDEDKGIMSFPVTLAELAEAYKEDGAQPANVYGDYVYQGAYVYDVSVEDGFKLRGRITHYTDEELAAMSANSWWYGDNDIERILYIGDYFYTVSSGMLKASMMDSLEEANSISY